MGNGFILKNSHNRKQGIPFGHFKIMENMNQPTFKDVLWVLLVFLIIIAAFWIAYHWFGMFHMPGK